MHGFHAGDYESRGLEAVKRVLLEIAQVCAAWREHIIVVGGLVPTLAMPGQEPPHSGSNDLDLLLDKRALEADQGYAELIKSLLDRGYQQGKLFQLLRTVELGDGGGAIEVVVDLLVPSRPNLPSREVPLVDNFRAITASGGNVAISEHIGVEIEGVTPDGRANRAVVQVVSIPAFLVMKGYALAGRDKPKDAYDIFFCVESFEGGPRALADACRPMLDMAEARDGYCLIEERFAAVRSYGVDSVVHFLNGSPLMGEREADQLRQDAFALIDVWLRAMGIRR